MSIQILTGSKSLIALGIGAGDVASLAALGQRFGNWWSAVSGDREFLALLDEDEYNILKRRGLLDLPAFNKRWRRLIRLLANGRPWYIEDVDMGNVLEDLPRFTAIMVCLVAALDRFASISTVQLILKAVLKNLLETTEHGEDILRSQYTTRLNAWRSTACLRGLNDEAEAAHQTLLQDGLVVTGNMPAGESAHMVEFLVWLLAGQDTHFTTSSSDVAGVAMCLLRLGIDVLSVEGMGSSPAETACRLIFVKENVLYRHRDNSVQLSKILLRDQSTTVPLAHPEESVSSFPVDHSTQNRCRSAWRAGQRAAEYVSLDIVIRDMTERSYFKGDSKLNEDILYRFKDLGTQEGRAEVVELSDLATSYAPAVNQELLTELEKVFQNTSSEALSWLVQQLDNARSDGESIDNPEMNDTAKVVVFCTFQSFLLGYYYHIFFRIVDTSSLNLQTVEGFWGFRSLDIFYYIRQFLRHQHQERKAAVDCTMSTSTRQAVLEMLSLLFLNYRVSIPVFQPGLQNDPWCMGIIAKRSLFINSLLGKCRSPKEIGCFTLVDVDTGGVPRDEQGLVRPGVEDVFEDVEYVNVSVENALRDVLEDGPSEDVTLHIEADWDGNPERALLCARYQGRRIATVSPARVDRRFCYGYVEPCIPRALRSSMPEAIRLDLHSLLSSRRLLLPLDVSCPVLFQALDRVRLRYTVMALYSDHSRVRLATDCVRNALKGTDAEIALTPGRFTSFNPVQYPRINRIPTVIVAGLST